MLNHLTATALRLEFEIRIGGEFVLPDAGSLKLTLRGGDGVPLAGYDKQALPDTLLNFVAVQIPAAVNTLAAGRELEMRYATLDFLSAGKSGVVTTPYRLIKFMPIQVTPEEVRQALGVSYGELTDQTVDLYQSYTRLVSKRPTFLASLQSGTVASVYANQILLYTEALRLAPSLQARILKQEEKDNALYTRFLIDFELLLSQLQDALADAENALDEFNNETVTAATPLLIVTQPTDPFTGA